MKTELTTNGLQPPEKPLRRADEDSIKGTIKWVREFFEPEEIFDLYNHDREVAQSFLEWYEQSGWMPANSFTSNDPDKTGYIITGPHTPERVDFKELWEIYCTETKNKHGLDKNNR